MGRTVNIKGLELVGPEETRAHLETLGEGDPLSVSQEEFLVVQAEVVEGGVRLEVVKLDEINRLSIVRGEQPTHSVLLFTWVEERELWSMREEPLKSLQK